MGLGKIRFVVSWCVTLLLQYAIPVLNTICGLQYLQILPDACLVYTYIHVVATSVGFRWISALPTSLPGVGSNRNMEHARLLHAIAIQ